MKSDCEAIVSHQAAAATSPSEAPGWDTYVVVVTQAGEDVLTMSSYHVSGEEDIARHKDGIRHCAAMLLSSIEE